MIVSPNLHTVLSQFKTATSRDLLHSTDPAAGMSPVAGVTASSEPSSSCLPLLTTNSRDLVHLSVPGAGTPRLKSAGRAAGRVWVTGAKVARPHKRTYKLQCLEPGSVWGWFRGDRTACSSLVQNGLRS